MPFTKAAKRIGYGDRSKEISPTHLSLQIDPEVPVTTEPRSSPTSPSFVPYPSAFVKLTTPDPTLKSIVEVHGQVPPRLPGRLAGLVARRVGGGARGEREDVAVGGSETDRGGKYRDGDGVYARFSFERDDVFLGRPPGRAQTTSGGRETSVD